MGLIAAFALTRVLGSMLYGAGAADPATLATTAAALLVAAVVANFIPAYPASRIGAIVLLDLCAQLDRVASVCRRRRSS